MLIDSGATTTAISASTAAAAGITIDERGFPEDISTANGAIAALPGVAAQVTIGGITARDLPVIVSPAFGDTRSDGHTSTLQFPMRNSYAVLCLQKHHYIQIPHHQPHAQ